MSDTTAPYTARHRAPEQKQRRPILTMLFAVMMSGLVAGSAAFAVPNNDREDISTTVQSLCSASCAREVPDRASRSTSRTSLIPAVMGVARIAKKSAPKIVEWVRPLPKKYESYCNYWQWRGTYNHKGEDISAPWGMPIRAIHAGYVKVQWDSGGGNMTIIQHKGSKEFDVYMHQSSYKIRSGYVHAGDVIGYVGQTGDASGPHLHLEIHPTGTWGNVTSPDKLLQSHGVHIGC